MPTRWQYKSEQGRKNHVDTNQQHSDQDQAEKENESSHQNECVPRNKRIDSMDKPCSRTDREFDLTVEMMVNDFDDERTLDEEEALENQEDHATELSDLQREGDMPLDQLLAMYGCGDAQSDEASSEGEKPEPTALRRLYDDKPEGVTRQNSEEVGTVPGPEEEDGDYSPDEDEWRKTIMVGSDYQASIPEGLCRYGDALPYENEDKLLWNPVQLTEQEVEDFLVRAQETNAQGIAAIPTGAHTRDDEQALYLLLQCGYNVEEALRRRRMNLQQVPAADTMSLWSEEECRNFENGLRSYGKDFHLIQQNKVRTRSVGELVQFYYLWKKTERHDIFANKQRLEKKKYNLHPGITDYMDRFLEEQDSGHRDRSSSPNISCLIYGDPKRQQRVPPQEETDTLCDLPLDKASLESLVNLAANSSVDMGFPPVEQNNHHAAAETTESVS